MATKSKQLQIRVTPREKSTLKRRAAAAGQDLSSYVLSRALPRPALEVEELIHALERDDEERRLALAALNDLLTGLAPVELREAIEHIDVGGLCRFLRNYVAAMVEVAAEAAGVPPPAWTRSVAPLDAPWFAAPFPGLRLHLLKASPVPFKRRNLFVDASLGARV